MMEHGFYWILFAISAAWAVNKLSKHLSFLKGEVVLSSCREKSYYEVDLWGSVWNNGCRINCTNRVVPGSVANLATVWREGNCFCSWVLMNPPLQRAEIIAATSEEVKNKNITGKAGIYSPFVLRLILIWICLSASLFLFSLCCFSSNVQSLFMSLPFSLCISHSPWLFTLNASRPSHNPL